jgi:hypothetical protein
MEYFSCMTMTSSQAVMQQPEREWKREAVTCGEGLGTCRAVEEMGNKR